MVIMQINGGYDTLAPLERQFEAAHSIEYLWVRT